MPQELDENAGLSVDQLLRAWKTMCAAAPSSQMAKFPGLELVFSGLPISFFNVGVLTGPVESAEDLRELAEKACRWAEDSDVPWFLLVTDEWLGDGVDAAEVLGEMGMAPAVRLTGMRADTVAALPAPPDDLEILSAGDDDTLCKAILDINGAAYGMPLEAAHDVLGTRRFWADHFATVGRKGTEPVSCTGVMISEGYRYVFFVATHPEHQRRGYADAAMRRALEAAEAAHGPMPTYLHATDAGRPVYERMGYEALTGHTLYIEEKFLAH